MSEGRKGLDFGQTELDEPRDLRDGRPPEGDAAAAPVGTAPPWPTAGAPPSDPFLPDASDVPSVS